MDKKEKVFLSFHLQNFSTILVVQRKYEKVCLDRRKGKRRFPSPSVRLNQDNKHKFCSYLLSSNLKHIQTISKDKVISVSIQMLPHPVFYCVVKLWSLILLYVGAKIIT
jgi:hypothetical protein